MEEYVLSNKLRRVNNRRHRVDTGQMYTEIYEPECGTARAPELGEKEKRVTIIEVHTESCSIFNCRQLRKLAQTLQHLRLPAGNLIILKNSLHEFFS